MEVVESVGQRQQSGGFADGYEIFSFRYDI
jgi:hypothetical protein